MARKQTDFIIIHCSATKATHDVDIADIDRWHREQGFRKVGYHFVIKRNGVIQAGRNLLDGGAHAGPAYNNRSIGVCLVGGVGPDGKKGENNFTPDQWEALVILVEELAALYPAAEVIGHRDIAAKDCPSFDAKQWWKDHTNK